MVIEVKSQQPEKQSSPKLVTDDGMVIEVKFVQTLKQFFPKLVTDDGMVIEVKPQQYIVFTTDYYSIFYR